MFEPLRAIDGDGCREAAAFTARWQNSPPRFAPWGAGSEIETERNHAGEAYSGLPAAEDLWSVGFAAGRAEAELALGREADAMDALLRALDRLAPMPIPDIAERLERDVRALLEQLVGTASVDEALLIARCAALADLAGTDGAAVLHASPDDAALLAATQTGLPIIADAGLPRGELLLIDGAGEAAAGPRTMLADWAAQSGDASC